MTIYNVEDEDLGRTFVDWLDQQLVAAANGLVAQYEKAPSSTEPSGMGIIFQNEAEAERIIALLMGKLNALGVFDPTEEEAADPETFDLAERVAARLGDGAKDDGDVAFTVWQNVERRERQDAEARTLRWTHTCRPGTHGAHSLASASSCGPCRRLVDMGLIAEVLAVPDLLGDLEKSFARNRSEQAALEDVPPSMREGGC